MAPHADDDDEVIIILSSITLPAECNPTLDNFVENGAYGSTREEVARHFICRRLGAHPRPQLPDAPPAPEAPEGDSEEGAK